MDAGQSFEKWYISRPLVARNLAAFLMHKENEERPESIWRLQHLISLGQELFNPQLINDGGIVKDLFREAWVDYNLSQQEDLKAKRAEISGRLGAQ